MFDLPASKRVRRAELNRSRSSTSPSPSARFTPDPELQSQAQARFAALFGDFALPQAVSTSKVTTEVEALSLRNENEDDEEEEEQSFEFRLFSNTSNKPAARIVLDIEEDEGGNGTFVRKERDKAYYFAASASGERKAGFEDMAVSGETVLQWQKIRARGLEVPWRVKTLIVHSSSKLKPEGSMGPAILVDVDVEVKDRKRCKPNKKRRLTLREKKRKKDKAEEERKKRNKGKEEAEREKKTRLNRARKVKRKLKEKIKKAGDAVVTVTDDGTNGDVDMLEVKE